MRFPARSMLAGMAFVCFSLPLAAQPPIEPKDGKLNIPLKLSPAGASKPASNYYLMPELKDSIPELVFLNSHDGTTAYQVRVGLYRVVCTNGLIVSAEAFPVFRVAHRGDVVADVVAAAAPAPGMTNAWPT